MAGLIISGTFTSMRNVVELNRLFKILPLNWILTQHFDSITKIKSLQVPILIIHGTANRVVPVAMSKVFVCCRTRTQTASYYPRKRA